MNANASKARTLASTVVFVVVASLLSSDSTSASPVPPDLRASLLLRTLAYDRNLADRAGGSQVTRLVVEGDDRGDTAAVTAALQSATERVSVAGLPIRVIRHR